MAAKRKAIGKKLRFEVFKRDGFKCQYCGKSSPDVILHVDHIDPVANGGDADILNLITSCQDCNLGKGARLLDDDSVLAKQKKQLAELNEKRQQLEMMLKWRKDLNSIDKLQIDEVARLFNELTSRSLTDYGRNEVKKWLKKYPLSELLESLEISAHQYLVTGSDGTTKESANKILEYIPRICHVRKSTLEKPYLPDLFKLKWLVKKEIYNCKEWEIMKILEAAHVDGVSISDLRGTINEAGTWNNFKDALQDITGVYYG